MRPWLATGEATGPDKEAALLESWKAYKTGFQQGVALFNKKPKKGIAFMQEQVKGLAVSVKALCDALVCQPPYELSR